MCSGSASTPWQIAKTNCILFIMFICDNLRRGWGIVFRPSFQNFWIRHCIFIMRQPDSKFQCIQQGLLIVTCLLIPPTWKEIVPLTFPKCGGTKNFFARFARESRFVPLTFKIVAPPLHRDVGAYGNIKEYDTIRDAILTCAQKPTWVSLICRTETTTKKCKTEKLKSENGYAHFFAQK